jgi:DNA-directed RNA polymerase specialized sigma24 family protein
MNIIDKLRTPIATLIVLCAALLAQLPHAADVFRIIVAGDGWPATLHSYAYAIALELAVLLFVVQRRNIESYVFAAVSIMVNLSYYSLHGVNLFSVAGLPAWLVSIALPSAIARYSHLLVDEPLAPEYSHAAPSNAVRKAQNEKYPSVSAVSAGVDVLAASEPPSVAENTRSTPLQPDAPAQPDKRTRAMQLRDEGYSAAEIARLIDAKYPTVQSWLRRASVQTNGATHS